MRPITFIICAAGEGLRMKAVSENIPKPLLMLDDKNLLQWSIESLDLRSQDQLIIVHRFEFEVEKIGQQLKLLYPVVDIQFMKLNKLTSGQAETAYFAKNIIRHKSIAIFNADTYFTSKYLRQLISQDDCDGLIPCFKASGNSWSFCKVKMVNSIYSVLEVTEKNRISEWCSVGYYYFRDCDDFLASYEASLKLNSHSERYIAPLYNQLISKNKDIRMVQCDIFKPMGTPEQIMDFWNVTIDEIKSMNKLNLHTGAVS